MIQDTGINRTTFKSCQGFLVHLGGAYELIKPYLHGLFLSENVWRGNRDPQGFCTTKREEGDLPFERFYESESDPYEDADEQMFEALLLDEVIGLHPDARPTPANDGNPPALVFPVAHLYSDIDALGKIFAGETPIQAIERPVSGARCVVFGSGDASGEGFGSLTTSPFGMLPLL